MEKASTEAMTLNVIAHIHTAFPTKFGIPRQSGLVDSLRGEIIFTPEYRNPDAVRGLEDFSHIWLVWQFSGAVRDTWSPTVRPPRLGGNTRIGVFATRSPFRPNPLGLSSVQLEKIEIRPEVGPVLIVRGADLMDGTPIYDIKPYIRHGQGLAVHGEMHFQPGKLHAVHPLRVVLVGGAGGHWQARPAARRGRLPVLSATALQGRTPPDGGCGSAR